MPRAVLIALLWLATALGCGRAPDRPEKAQPAPTTDARAQWLFDPAAFEPLGPPPAGGWRTRVSEPGQTLADFEASTPNRPGPPRELLYLQPLTPYPNKVVLEDDLPSLMLEEQGFVTFVFSPRPEALARFLTAFHGLETRVQPGVTLPTEALVPARVHEHHVQYDARALLEALGPTLPADAYSMTLLVARDIVVSEDQEYAFGYGLHKERLSIASFAQLDPQFGGRERGTDFQRRIRERGHKLVAHEVGHTLGMGHCDRHACVMNGIAHVDELDATPLRLCPSCLRKLTRLVGFEGQARYEALATYYESVGLEREREWVEGRLAQVR